MTEQAIVMFGHNYSLSHHMSLDLEYWFLTPELPWAHKSLALHAL